MPFIAGKVNHSDSQTLKLISSTAASGSSMLTGGFLRRKKTHDKEERRLGERWRLAGYLIVREISLGGIIPFFSCRRLTCRLPHEAWL